MYFIIYLGKFYIIMSEFDGFSVVNHDVLHLPPGISHFVSDKTIPDLRRGYLQKLARHTGNV